jgi:hypothetical protein
MPRKVTEGTWKAYFAARADGQSPTAAAKIAGMSRETAFRFERTGKGSGLEAARSLGLTSAGDQTITRELSKEAKRAMTDFAYFRRRYLGRRTVGWQTDAANKVVEAIERGETSDDEQRMVINAPPGSGKSTTFTHDIPVWLIVRNRGIRIMLGSEASGIATAYSRRVRTTLARRIPIKASTRELRMGTAFDAEVTLAADFGDFKPGNDLIWRAGEFTVLPDDDSDPDEKEATVTAYGRDSEFLGGRFDVVIWDDVVTVKNMRTESLRNDLFVWWDTTAESRVEPGGVFILQGQRIAAGDLYRYCLNKREVDGTPTYQHLKYRAHDDSKCPGHHHRQAAWPETCLLDPRRLPWKKIAAIREQDGRLFEVVYQQGDVDPEATMIDRLWIDGGEDDKGQIWPGCRTDEVLGDIPEVFRDGSAWSVMTVDPSPTKWWGILWLAYHPATDQRLLVAAERRKMPSNQLLDMDLDSGAFKGIAEDWRKKALEVGLPLDGMFVERNAAQRFMLQSSIWNRWTQTYGVPILPHDTHSNKNDPQYGMSVLVAPVKSGRYRLPRRATPHEEGVVERLIHEATHYPAVEDSDLLMALWFFEHHLAKTWQPKDSQYQLQTPTYLREVRRGIGSGQRDTPGSRLRFRLGAGRP